MNQSETGIGDKKLSVELHVSSNLYIQSNRASKLLTFTFKTFKMWWVCIQNVLDDIFSELTFCKRNSKKLKDP